MIAAIFFFSMTTAIVQVWPPDTEPWPWALTFVLVGWTFLGLGCCAACCVMVRLGCNSTRRAEEDSGACQRRDSGTSPRRPSLEQRTLLQIPNLASVGTQTGEREDLTSFPEKSPSPSRRRTMVEESRFSTPLKQRCVYSTHPSQRGSPDLVKIMACRASPIMRDLDRGSKSASSARENQCCGH